MLAPSSGTRSRPCHSTWPATIFPGGMSISFITVFAVTLLPQPDSPTTPSVSPASIVMSTPSTACSQPSSVLKWVLRPLISSRAMSLAPGRAPPGSGRWSMTVQRAIHSTCLGSSASRRPSPMKLIVSTVMKMAVPGNRAQCTAMSM